MPSAAMRMPLPSSLDMALPLQPKRIDQSLTDIPSPATYHSADPAGLKLPLEMGVLSFVQNVDKELRNGGKASTCGIHAGI